MLENDDNTILKKPRDEDSDALLQERKDMLQTVIITNSLSETKSINFRFRSVACSDFKAEFLE